MAVAVAFEFETAMTEIDTRRDHRTKPAHISQKDWDAVDSPELTEVDFARMKPAKEVLPVADYDSLVRKLSQRVPRKTPVKGRPA